MIKVIFFGTEQFAVSVLNSLLNASEDFSIACVVTQPPRPVGRKQIVTPSPVAQVAAESQIEIYTPTTLKKEDVVEYFKKFNADVFVVAQYGLIIPNSILKLPKHGCINVHGSLLPKYRGASPIQTAILEGETETGVTFMVMDELVDHGPIFSTYTIPILETDTTEHVFKKLGELSAVHFPTDLKKFILGELISHEQDHSHATFTKLLSRETGYIQWNTMNAKKIVQMIHALVPWPGVTTILNGTPLKLISAHVANNFDQKNNVPGTIHIEKDTVWIETIEGELNIDELQPAGSAVMSAAAYARGNQSLSNSLCSAMPINDVSQK